MPGTKSTFDALLKRVPAKKSVDKDDVKDMNKLKQKKRDKLASAFVAISKGFR